MGFATLGGPRGAPGHTLTPEVLRPKQLLHLLPSDLDAGLPHHQACGETDSKDARRETEEKDGNKIYIEKMIKKEGRFNEEK